MSTSLCPPIWVPLKAELETEAVCLGNVVPEGRSKGKATETKENEGKDVLLNQ